MIAESTKFDWMHLDKAAEELGLSKHVIKGWFENHLVRGVHYNVIGHQTLIHIARLNQWLDEYGRQESAPAAADSASRYSARASAEVVHRSPGKYS